MKTWHMRKRFENILHGEKTHRREKKRAKLACFKLLKEKIVMCNSDFFFFFPERPKEV